MPTQPCIVGTARLNNFRLDYVPAALEQVRRARVRILLDGVEVRTRVSGATIRDVLNEQPNSCRLTFDGVPPLGGGPLPLAPTVGEDLRITINASAPRLLFAGTLQTTDQWYEQRPTWTGYPCTAIDYTTRLNYRRPFGTWVEISATTIGQSIIARFAPQFGVSHIENGLDTVSITFDGTEEFIACLGRLAALIGGYCKVEDMDAYLFLEDTTDPPDPIDSAHRPLDEPPITVRYDDSQLRTRVYGKGHGESLLSDVNVGENTLPIASAVMFNAAGGRAIVGTTADGATSIQISYTTIQNPNVGALVGTGAVPSTAPLAMAQAGVGLGTGTYRYAYTDQTAAGESLPSPYGEVAVGVVANPTTAPTVNKPTTGTGPNPGSHWYLCTFVTPTGETLAGPISGQVITGDVEIPPATFWNFTCNIANVGSQTDRTYYGYAVTFVDASGGETTPYRVVNPWYLTEFNHRLEIFGIPVSSDPAIVRRRIYRTKSDGSHDSANGFSQLYFAFEMDNNVGTSAIDGRADSTLGGPPPTVNTAKVTTRTVPLTTIPIGGTSVNGRKLYRTAATDGTVFKFLATIADNTTTTYTDTQPDAALGAVPPTVNTAGGSVNQVALSGIAIGQTGTTGRKIYRTAANATQLKFLKTIADNTTLTTTDAAADGTLGANVPTGDTSGLKQPEGQVNAGSTSLLIASTLNFSAGGGWLLLGGGQVVRYTGFGAGNVLTGIPSTGAGSIRTSVLFGTPVVGAHTLAGVVPTTSGPPPYLPDPTVAPAGGYSNLGDGPPYPFVSGDLARNWQYTFVSAGGETRPSPPTTLTAPLSGVGPYLGSVGVPIGSVGTIARRIYRTSAGGTVFKLAGTLADNVTTTFNDHTADGALGVAPPTVSTAVIGGVPVSLAKGSPVNIFVQRDDLAAQAEAAERESTPTYTSTGIHEHQIVDERRAEASLIEQCDADLVLFARPIITYVLATHDVKAKSGKTLHIDLPGYPVGDFVIQDVTIDQIDVSPGTPPRSTLTASSVAFSLPDVLRRLITAEQAG